MKTNIISLLILSTFAGSAMARDTISDYSVDEAMSIEKIKQAVGNEVSFYFGNKKPKKIKKSMGEFKTNKKTNAFGKSDKEACQWAFASAMKSLKQRAIKEGGNAVINIKSNYKGTLTSSDTSFQCGAGSFVAGVALVGEVVKIEK
ncbi:excinuclease ATPase subunit [Aliikangiella sp. IMCC44359]|uniref:excinuclease ATPase subunit n=1 Tax=Aliikangiella sp. IMCC44359 TaxID=3459125 RepID=UPI00403AA6AB